MKTESSIDLLTFHNDDMARVYLKQNGIKGAFVWKDRADSWEVLEGDPEEQCGFKAATFTTKREATAYCVQINQRISELNR